MARKKVLALILAGGAGMTAQPQDRLSHPGCETPDLP